MTSKYEQYRSLNYALPEQTLAWNMYGPGVENIGRNGRPETFPIPEPGDDQLLVRVDSVGMCFSDVKLIRQGGSHPKLYNRDLAKEPTRLGHEVAITIIKVGKNLQDQYQPGQRLAVQPDIYQQGKSTAYGYTVPGGLIQYHLIGPEVLVTDEGACLLPLEGDLGYAESSLMEPWGCVMAAYTQRRRLEPKPGGIMWIVGRPGDTREYTFSAGLDAPATIILTDVPPSVEAMVMSKKQTDIIIRDGLQPDEYAAWAHELTDGKGFDDIVVLDPRSAEMVSAAAKLIARRGTFNMVGETPLDGLPLTDVGRLHYDYIAFVGNRGPDIAASYGEARNRCELHPHGSLVVIGAGGPMGQMHVQRALELPDGPRLVIATEINDVRLAAIQERFAPLARKNGRSLLVYNPNGSDESLYDFVMQATDQLGADDVVVSVPVAALMAEAATVMNPNGMLVLFAGVPNGTYAPLDLSAVYLHNAQFTGTSGLTLNDQRLVMERALDGSLSPGRSVAAIGGMNAAPEGIRAMMDGRFPGKVVIFPQIPDLPLMGLDELAEKMPDIAAKLDEDGFWTNEAEAALIENYWQTEDSKVEPMWKKIILAILLLVVLVAGGFLAFSTFTGATETAATEANTSLPKPDTPFIPDQDGFQFRNYTSRYPEGDLTVAEARAMFGDVVCTRLDGETCIPDPKVIAWIDEMNETMNEVGHCVGFTVASGRIYYDILPVNDLGANITFELPPEAPVLRTISQSYASYYASNVWAQEVKGKTPTEIVEALLALDEPADIGIYYPEYGRNGHSVLGYDVVDQGDGIYHIMVYDNNRPGESPVIVVDTNADTWFYAEGAVNPDQPIGNYRGDAETTSLSFIPISAYNEPLACPANFAELCPVASDASGFSVVTLVGEVTALVDSASGQIGQLGGSLVNTITGGRFLPVRGELYSRLQPIMLFSADELFTLQAQGSLADEPTTISVANPAFSVVVDGLVAQPEQIEQLNFDPATRQVEFIAGGEQRPFIEFAFTQNGTTYAVQMAGLAFDNGQNLAVMADATNGDLQFISDGLADADLTIIVAQLTSDGEAVFANAGATISVGGLQALDLDNWDGFGPMTLLIDEDGDGTFESSSMLDNQPVADILAALGSAGSIVKSLQNVVPYLDDAQTEAVAAVLPTLNLSGRELGAAYLKLPDLQPDDLAATLTNLNLPPAEIGRFMAGLRLGPDETNALLDDLGLTVEGETAVEAAIADEEAVQEVLDEWAFINEPDDEGLPTFLDNQGLTDDQVSAFIEQVDTPQQIAIPRSCANIPAPSEADVRVRFINSNASVVNLYWKDALGELVQYGSLNPGEARDQETYVGHNWVVKDSNGNTLLEYPITGSPTQCATIP